jgi:hypothetical protein
MRRAIVPLLLLALLLPLAACETDEPTAEERAELEPLVRELLVRLAQAYRDMSTEPLEGFAAPRMMEDVRLQIQNLRAGGDRLVPELVEVEIARLSVIRRANAYVATVETWDTRRLDAYTGEELGRNPSSVLHSNIQLKRVEGRWLALYREVAETATGPRFIVPTPSPS